MATAGIQKEATASMPPVGPPRELLALEAVARGFARTLGPRVEVVLHDLRRPESSLVFIEGNVTRRAVGAPVTDLVLELLRAQGDNVNDAIGYPSRTSDGRWLKSSTVFIRNSRGKVVGCMCINIDITEMAQGMAVLEDLLRTTPIGPSLADPAPEHFARSIGEVLEAAIAEAVKSMGIPVEAMHKDDKLRLVDILDRRGTFLVKGAVEQVATVLGVSRYTVYNYLEEARAPRAIARAPAAGGRKR